VAEWRVPLSDLAYGPAEEQAVLRVLASKWVSTGPEVSAFEAEFAEAVGCAHAVAVSSATAALHLALLALGVRPGDEVVQPALNFVAAANCTLAVGARPVFADIASVDDPTVTADTVEPLLTPRTRVVVAMHYGGTPAATEELARLCDERGVVLLEDACHAVGARYGSAAPSTPEVPVGALGRAAAFSFFSNKNLATAEGGMLTTSDAEVAAEARLLRSHGMTTMSWDRFAGHARSYDVTRAGFNYRMDDLRAALGRAQLAALPANNAARVALLAAYRERLHDLAPGWVVPHATSDRPTSGHLAVVLAPDPGVRDRLVEALHADGIQTSRHYPCVPGFSVHAGPTPPRSADFSARAVTLPLYPGLDPAAVQEVCDVVEAVATGSR
jgi:dTDP-4-amino-4,6-dideoxygalactose transaminase